MFENDYTINGKHATYLKFLAKKNARDDQSPDNPTAARLFERYIDVYMNAAVFGLLYNRTAKRDNSSDDRARVYADAFANDRAFRYDTLPEKVEEFRKNLELFHDYVRGGIEVMYEQFTDGCQTQDDYLSKTYEVMTTFKKELEGVSYADEIAHLIK